MPPTGTFGVVVVSPALEVPFAEVVNSLVNVDDWAAVGASLCNSGWHRLPAAISGELCDELSAAPSDWRPLPPEEGGHGVRQRGFGSYRVLDEADMIVRDVASEIAASITAASAALPSVPPFNEVTWTRYPAGEGFITKHRDPQGVGGVIAIATLVGRATFRVWSDEVVEWETEPGDTVLLRAYGWPNEGELCPIHEVESPVGERLIMTLRHNRGGAGAAYF